MSIGMLTTGYPHEGDPVAGAFVRGMARALAARGHAVRVLCAARPGDAPAVDPGVTVRPVRYAPARTFYGAGAPDNVRRDPRAAVGALAFVAALAAAARRELAACDALVSHFVVPCGLVGGLVRAGRPHLAVIHGSDGHLLARAPRWLQRAVLRGATRLRYTHAALRDALPDAGVAWEVRPMGYDPAPAAPRARDDGRVVALALGRLVPVKGVDRAIRAVGAARAAGLDVALVVAGDGPERARLEGLAAPLGGAVRFAGAVDGATRDGLLGAADVLLHAVGPTPDGRTEGAPVAVLEAMGAGLPVVALDAGGVRALVGDGGLVVEGEAALADALARVAADAALRRALGARARARAWPLRWEADAARVERALRA